MKLLFTTLALLTLSGCSMMPDMGLFGDTQENADSMQEETSDIINIEGVENTLLTQENEDQEEGIDEFGAIVKPAVYSSVNGAYKSRPLAKHIGDYVRNMAQDLVSNMEYVTERTPVAVTHFSLIDSDLKETNLLGYQIAESFAHEFHKFRMPVVEFKATQFIRVTETGDFVMSRDFLDLTSTTPIQYVLTGTMTKHQGGYLVNARMLGMESNVIVASSQMFVPFYVVDALIPSESSKTAEIVDGVRLIKGE
ncbi:FlgO family outer membrane protein [Glaciecola sp.]|jgi:TolB-like protein|uniref:FlgO family outer membrane protein n=1 Tax=Glaciecola sp. MF2-115 TaxID=3384827 RepID=UPI0039893422|mmetsp:Transcript_20628/g.65293  ORF Transcript_20628/g.65293 Transcript_20628/m.65293 type:complete len:252 (-) Transcript_20628:1164-1919(-)